MNNITYEQFEEWCKYWNMTIEEGYRAICFTNNIVYQNTSNECRYAEKICNDTETTDMYKTLVRQSRYDAMRLSTLFNDLNTKIYTILISMMKKQIKKIIL